MALLSIAALLSPLEVPLTVESVGRVLPAREWVLHRTPSGALTATLTDHRTGAVSTTFVAEPARGDAGRFDLGPIAAQARVEAGETIGSFVSGDLSLRLAELDGQISEAQAQLRLQQSSQKASLVDAAQSEVARAEQARARAAQVAERQRRLVDADVAAVADLEAAESSVQLAEADVAVAQARLRVVETGGSPEASAVTEARIATLVQTARALTQRQQSGALRIPISGRVQREFSRDTLLLVVDTTAYHLAIPVTWQDHARVEPGQEVAVSGAGLDGLTARVLDVRSAAASGSSQAYLVALAALDPATQRLIPGLMVRCTIRTGTRRPLEMARGWWASIVST